MNTRIILASGSPRRRELLAQIGLKPEIIVSDVEEQTVFSSPEKVVKDLSMQKAMAVAAGIDDNNAIVIAADTVVTIDGRILGKPADHEEAAEMIRTLQGRAHEVFTGVTIVRGCRKGDIPTFRESFAERTAVHVFPMSEDEIRGYADSEEPMDKAGAYGIQGAFAAYISGIEGDYNNVVGLPVGRLYQLIKRYLNG